MSDDGSGALPGPCMPDGHMSQLRVTESEERLQVLQGWQNFPGVPAEILPVGPQFPVLHWVLQNCIRPQSKCPSHTELCAVACWDRL